MPHTADSGAVGFPECRSTNPLKMICSVASDRYRMGWRLPETDGTGFGSRQYGSVASMIIVVVPSPEATGSG